MRIKFLGKWYDIQCFNITKNDGTAFITKDYESSIEDIEINGRHLAASVESDVISVYPKGRVTEGKYDVMKVGKEDNFPTKNGKFRVGDIVMAIDTDGEIFRGCIKEVHDSGTVCISNDDGERELDGVPFRELVDDSDGADPYYAAVQIRKMQAEYWKEKAQRQSDSKEIDWEQRQFFLAAQIYAHKDCLYPDCMTEAKNFIDHYREETEL
jgi:hypothetical protein